MSILGCVTVFASAEAQELSAYLQEAERNSPQIRAFELKYGIATEKVKGENSLPDTELGAAYFVSEPETRTGAQKARFSIKQMLPWFGTITARQNYATAMADAEYLDLVIAKRKLALSVGQSYYRLYVLEEKKKVLLQNILLLETYEQLALTSVEVGKASAVDVLRLQIRKNEMAQQKEVLEQDYLAERTSFNKLLDREGDAPVAVVPTLAIPESDPILPADSLKVHPELLQYDRLYESVVRSESLNQKESMPKLGVGMDYVTVAERPDMVFDDNGKDILMPMVSVSLPLFNTRYRSTTKQNELKQEELRAKQQDRLNALNAILATALGKREAARIGYRAQTENLVKAQQAETILISNYETGTIDFEELLDVQELQLKIRMDLLRYVGMYFEQSAMINYLNQ